jgi:hypothetical protein
MVSSTAYMISDVCGHEFMTVVYIISCFWLHFSDGLCSFVPCMQHV